MKILSEKRTDLSASTICTVRFSEVDSMEIVWHGHYALYFEEAREAFGVKYAIRYKDIMDAGYSAPLSEFSCKYKKAITYGKKIRVEAVYMYTDTAKLVFEYFIYDAEDNTLMAVGRTSQVFLDSNRKLVLQKPPFYLEWGKKNNLCE